MRTHLSNARSTLAKIIERARQQYLLAEYRKRVVETSSTTAAVLTDVQASWSHYVSAKLLAKVERVPVPPALAKDPLRHWSDVQLFVEKNREIVDGDVGEKFPVIWATAVRVHQVVSHEATATNEVGAIVDACADVLMTSLDKEVSGVVHCRDILVMRFIVLLCVYFATPLSYQHGHTVTQHHIFQDLASHWEREFLNDMQALNVRPCDVLTRVSEYVPEIVGFVSKIMENGYAYGGVGQNYRKISCSSFHTIV